MPSISTKIKGQFESWNLLRMSQIDSRAATDSLSYAKAGLKGEGHCRFQA